MPHHPQPPHWVSSALAHGQVIVAHPLALHRNRQFDPIRQQILTRYYHAAGAGGIAVGVHTTQFSIRDPKHGLLQPVLELASKTISQLDQDSGRQTLKIAGLCGDTNQAISEAELAHNLGYHAGLLSPAAFVSRPEQEFLEHARIVAQTLPIFGFYLQTAVGGRPFSKHFWRQFVEIPNVIAIKIAPFNRYQTLDVIQAVAESGRSGTISLYTGNDDHFVLDLLTDTQVRTSQGTISVRMAGGLLGQWACWTLRAVELMQQIRALRSSEEPSIPSNLLTQAAEWTDANAAVFDAANSFRGCIPGIHEVLRRQGLLEGIECLDPEEVLSPGQSDALDRIQRDYPHLTDDVFVQNHLPDWINSSR